MTRRLTRAGTAGFTLIEMLVVVVIIGLFVGAALLSVTLVDNERHLDREAQRLRGLLELVREEALMQSREFALYFSEVGYRPYVYDHAQMMWVAPAQDRLLAPREFDDSIRVELIVEGRTLVLEPDFIAPEQQGETPQPQVMLLSSGEITPFELGFYRELHGGRIWLRGAIDGTYEIEREGFDAP